MFTIQREYEEDMKDVVTSHQKKVNLFSQSNYQNFWLRLKSVTPLKVLVKAPKMWMGIRAKKVCPELL